MTCTETHETLPALLYGDLPADRAAAAQEHLAGCPACRAELAALQRLRKGLDQLPAPAVRVDLPGLYREAARLEQRRLRRWRRAALAAFAAAAVVLLAFALNLEVRADRHQLVVRWGSPPPAEPAPAVPRSESAVAPLPPPVTPFSVEELRLLKDLIHALAADVEARDRGQQLTLARLQQRLELLQAQSDRRWADAERTNAAFYTALFGPLDRKGGRP